MEKRPADPKAATHIRLLPEKEKALSKTVSGSYIVSPAEETEEGCAFPLHEGTTYDVLVDGFDEENLLYLGRTYMDCIEIDAQVILSTEEELFPGRFVRATITGVCDADLVGEVIV